MPSRRDRKHIILTKPPRVDKYTPHGKKITPKDFERPANRQLHGAKLTRELTGVVAEAELRSHAAGVSVTGSVPGVYVQFESQPGVDLQTSTLDAQKQGVELVAVREVLLGADGDKRVQVATVFVPLGSVKHFITKFAKYSSPLPKKKFEHRHEEMLDRIATLRLATLRALWTDDPSYYPHDGEATWWELWLRRHDGNEVTRVREFTEKVGIRLLGQRLEFEDRIVCLVFGTPEQLSVSLDVLNDIAEVRKAKETAAFFVDQTPAEQGAWVQDLVQRTQPPPSGAPAVCILDTGVNSGHPLIALGLDVADKMAVDPIWGTDDHDGHGTEMAGLALYGNLVPALAGSQPVFLRHRLESVKVLPPHPRTNDPNLYGAIMAEATARSEISAPSRRRCFSMAVTAEDSRDCGQPTSWSAAIDALAAGRAFDPATHGLVYLPQDEAPFGRLFVLAAGNVPVLGRDHILRSDSVPVHDPGQAWNALTVGACTDLAFVKDPQWAGWQPVARGGDLSPWSTTSIPFAKEWPSKPDVVFEGGNVVVNGNGDVDYPVPELSLLSTYFRPALKPLVLTWATSAACSQVSRMCAIIAAEYPGFWPETIRSLVVHSAEWTPQMWRHIRTNAGKKEIARSLLRRFGHGVPSLDRCLRSAANALTLVAQGTIAPFENGKMREMHLYELPWPTDVLQGLGATNVVLRVTLSYFVEPNPARRGWQKRFKYQSHGLRFEVKRPTEDVDDFRKRINEKALDEEDDKKPSAIQDHGWALGDLAQTRGSIHSDVWEGSAAELADRGVVGVYPVSGWWKEQQKKDRSGKGVRYALLVSIETPGVDVDIWTPVANEVGVVTPIET